MRKSIPVLILCIALSLSACTTTPPTENIDTETDTAKTVITEDALQDAETYCFTAEVVKYGNDALCVKVTDAGDSTLDIGFELYVGVADGYDNYPVGCLVEATCSGEINAYEYGTYGPDRTISVHRVQ